MTLAGGCHCGAIVMEMETAIAPEDAETRACGCTFCRAHGAIAWTDPKGRLTIRIADESRVTRYRWGLATADFLICSRCGIFAAAVMEDAGRRWATVNVNALADRARFTRTPQPVSYEGEDRASRIERRKQRWTPVAEP